MRKVTLWRLSQRELWSLEGLACQGECLIPDVRVSGENAVLEGLGGHPAHGQKSFPSFPVVVCLVDVSCHAEICGADRRHGS